jgi:rare lipoprotein A
MAGYRVALAAVLLLAPVSAFACSASWYGGKHHGRLTASGAKFNMNALTAASPSLPFGTKVRVSRKGKSVVVIINDRGPAKRLGRCIDLSKAAAARLGMIRAGVANVRLQVLN